MVQEKKIRITSWVRIILISIGILFAASRFYYKIFVKDEKRIETVPNYNGPFIESENIETVYSDSTIVRIRLKAPKQLELQNGDRIFPKGVWIEFFDKTGKKTSTLSANQGTHFKEVNNYNVKGNVIIKNLEKQEQLNTEELDWDPESKKVKTEKFVRIETPEQILTGDGLDANQDFTYYKIRKPRGIFPIEKDDEDEE